MIALLSQGVTVPGVWTRRGIVFDGDPTTDEGAAQEPSVIRESGAQILSGTVFKMWYKGGWDTPHMNYAESVDGISWTQYGSNPVLANIEHPFVFKNGSTYYLYAVPSGTQTQFNLWTSADGLSWSLDTAGVVTAGAGGSWDDFQMGNIFVWLEGAGDWRGIYEAHRNGVSWKMGYITSADGRSWTKYGSNPVITETNSNGGPHIYKASSGVYWMFYHRSVGTYLPTDINRAYSSNLTTWTRSPARNFFSRNGTSEGAGDSSNKGQVADAHLLEVNGQVYMYYTAMSDGSQKSGSNGIALAISRLSFEKLILHSE